MLRKSTAAFRLPLSAVSAVGRCSFDKDSAAGRQFNLLFTSDPQNVPNYKVTATNPGQFFYQIFYTGSPGTDVNFNVTLPYPFVTKGANPVHGYDGAEIDENDCYVPGTGIPVTGATVLLSEYGNTDNPGDEGFGDTETRTIIVTVPSTGVVYLEMHLDYGLKGAGGYAKSNVCGTGNDANNAVDVCHLASYTFSVDTGLVDHSDAIQSQNIFKKSPGVAGLTLNSISDPLANLTVEIYDGSNKKLGAVKTDADGWYQWTYKYTGKAATFTVKVPAYGLSQKVTLKSNGFLVVNFTVP